MSKINWPQAVLGMFFIGCATAVARPSLLDKPVPVTVTSKTTPPKVKTVVKTRTVEKVRVVHLPDGEPPDGYMSRNDCYHIPEAMKINDVMYRFGWPAGENGRAMGLGSADYPIRENHGARCHVSFPYGTVSNVTYHSDHDDYEGSETWPDTN
jgi:hypothetical protein